MARRPVPKVYPNLAAEMTRECVSDDDIAALIGKTPEQINNRMLGKSGDFSVTEALTIQKKLFPKVDMFELFERVEPSREAVAG